MGGNMKREVIFTTFATLLGSLVEEGIEEIFPGVGELNYTGEISGLIAGLLGSQLTKDEMKESIRKFIKYCYKVTNEKSLNEDIQDEELELFTERFSKIPKKEKQKIINSFKSISPYEYAFIKDFLNGLEGA